MSLHHDERTVRPILLSIVIDKIKHCVPTGWIQTGWILQNDGRFTCVSLEWCTSAIMLILVE